MKLQRFVIPLLIVLAAVLLLKNQRVHRPTDHSATLSHTDLPQSPIPPTQTPSSSDSTHPSAPHTPQPHQLQHPPAQPSASAAMDAGLADALRHARYQWEAIDPKAPHARGALSFAANPRQQLRTWLSEHGVEFASGLRSQSGVPPWSVQLSLQSAGREDASTDATSITTSQRTLRADSSRAEITDPALGLVEWYENQPAGIEQGFTLSSPPAGNGLLQIRLSASNGARFTPSDDAATVHIQHPDGRPLLACSALKAWDADGRILDSHMSADGSSLTLTVADAGARYPVTIDPLFTNIEARLAEEIVTGDEFATALALNAHTALVGAPGADGIAGPNSGAAYIFTRSGTRWEFQAKLVADDAALDHQFGNAAALGTDTAVLGAPGATAAYVFVRSNNQWTQQAKLLASDASSLSLFGCSVSVSSETAVIGASGANAAYVFTRSNSLWTQQAKLIGTQSVTGDEFGSSVGLDTDTAVVGAPSATVGSFATQGCMYVFVRSGASWTQQQRLTASNGARYDRLGSAVAISGNTAIAGLDSSDPLETGRAYVFLRTSSTWAQQAQLTGTSLATGSRFGAAVAIEGNQAVVGAPANDAGSQFACGSTYVFLRTGSTWAQQAKLAATGGSPDDLFGASVALSSGTLLAGSPQDATAAGAQSGSAEVFLLSGSTWSSQAQLLAGNSAGFDLAGSSVALSADTALIGVPYDDSSSGADAGAAYVFTRSGSRWRRQAKLYPSDPAASALFGSAVALDGDKALVGAPMATVSGATTAGAAYLFARANSAWTQEAKLTATSPVAADQFGKAVALKGQTALVGIPFRDPSSLTNAGAVCVFTCAASTWSVQATLTAPTPAASDFFGSSVALSGETALVGAPANSPALGSAHAFLRTGTSWNLQATLQGSDTTAGDGFGSAVAMENNTALIGSPSHTTIAGAGAGTAYLFTRTDTTWTQQARLTAADGAANDHFGSAVAVRESMALIGAPSKDLANNQDAGTAYLFTSTNSLWSQQAQFGSGLDSSAGDLFGAALALDADTALVGAALDDTSDVDAGSAYSFRLGELPAILTPPASRTVVPGTTLTFTVTASGYAPLRYQWRRNGVEIAGATASSLTLTVPSQAPFTASEGSYDVLVSNAGGVALSSPAILKVNALSVLTQVDPTTLDPRSNAQGFLLVRISPDTLTGTAWRFVGEQLWRTPGIPVGGLATGDREIEFRPIPGYLHPLREPVSIVSGSPTSVVDREYFPVEEPATASLNITLLPASVSATARWRFLGENDTAFQSSATTRTGLSAGIYIVEFSDVTGYSTPRPLSVSVSESQAKTASATYSLPDATVGARPQLAGFDSVVAAGTANPTRFVGQIRNDAGAGTGFVVKPRVVCTAAHVVFDEVAGAPFTGLKWLFQLERGSHDPVAQTPRGSYILSGYSTARAQQGSIPGQSTPESQNLDAAALWFYEKSSNGRSQNPLAARGGSSGYLASDAAANEWLLSSRLKTIVGYPLDGIPPANQGRIHSVPPLNASFTQATGRVYLTSDMTSSAGNSGGPVCVQYDDGRYYPAAIYIGGSTQTRVRAIDSDVISLFTTAENSANSGLNFLDSGQSLSGSDLAGPASGTLQVVLEPASARTDGAAWRIGSNSYLLSGQTRSFLQNGKYSLQFKPLPGYRAPDTRIVTVNGNTTVTATYVLVPRPALSGPASIRVPRGTPLQKQVVANSSPTSYAAEIVSGASLASMGLSFNTSTGELTGSPSQEGSTQLRLTASNETGTSDALILALTVIPPPPVLSGTSTLNATVGVPLQSQITASNSPSSYSASLSGAPSLASIGLALDSGTGVLTGIPTTAGTYSLTIIASNEAGSSSPFSLSLVVAPSAPSLTGPTELRTVKGAPITSPQFQATNSPSRFAANVVGGASLSSLGLTFNSTTGALTGTPTQTGSFPLSFTASNSAGTSAPLLLTLTVIPPAPVLSGASTLNATAGVLLQQQITASNSPSSYSASLSGAPSLAAIGLALDSGTGLLTGIPTTAGTSTLTIIASNEAGSSSPFSLSLVVAAPPAAPVLTGPAQLRTIKSAFITPPQLQATNSPSRFAANVVGGASLSSLGLTFNSTTGALTGTPTQTGSFPLSFTASNSAGTSAPLLLTLTVIPPAPVLSGASTLNATAGVLLQQQITASNSPSSYSASLSGAPSLASIGLALDSGTGLLTGIPTTAGTYSLTIIASNEAGSSSPFSLSLVVAPPPVVPVLTGPTQLRTLTGTPITPLQFQATNSPSRFAANVVGGASLSSLGLSFDSTTGALSGTPTQTGSFSLSVTASNDAGSSAPLLLALNVTQPGRLFASLSTPNGARGSIEPAIPTEGRVFTQGSLVKLTAIPAPGSLFAGWTGTTSSPTSSTPVSSSNPALSLTASSLMEVQAHFIPNPFLQLGGNYAGLGRPSSPSGSDCGISLTLIETGAFTGRLNLGSKSFVLSGKFDSSGNTLLSLPQGKGLPNLLLSLNFTPTNSGSISGSLQAQGSETSLSTISLRRVPWSTTNPSRLAGNYTVLLPPADNTRTNPAFPRGTGYATLKIDTAGKATFTGKLGDGTTLSASCLLDSAEQLPLFTSPAALLGGSLCGSWSFDADSAPTASLSWVTPARSKAAIYPAPFTGTLDAVGNRFTPPPTDTRVLDSSSLQIAFDAPEGVSLPPSLTATLDTKNKLTLSLPNPSLLQLTLNSKTGALSGSFRLASKSVSFSGVLLQQDRFAAALFLLPTQKASGSLSLAPVQ